jgi:CO/xanthine dehydrogenase Mo-binding subunit
MLNPDYGHYKIYSTRDIPTIKTIFVTSYEPSGPFGAKSVGELVMNGGLPAISNAIYHAAGVRLRTAPFTPDRVLEALHG